MRKLAPLLLLIMCTTATAQIEKGSKIIGTTIGNINYNFDEDLFSISLNPFMAKFITDRVALGGSASVSVFFIDGPEVYVGLQPTVRLYNKPGKDDRFFLQAGAGVTSLVNEGSFFFSYNAGAGYNRFINKNLALELGLHYNGITGDAELNNLSLNLGVQVFLAKGERLFERRR